MLLEKVDEKKIAIAGGNGGEIVENRKDEGNQKEEYKVKYECSMEEDVLSKDPITELDNRMPTYHAYSASGNVTA